MLAESHFLTVFLSVGGDELEKVGCAKEAVRLAAQQGGKNYGKSEGEAIFPAPAAHLSNIYPCVLPKDTGPPKSENSGTYEDQAEGH